MALLQPRLNLKVAQKQVLTPGLVQMVSLLALNKQELKEMIDAEIMENPVLEELDESVPSIDDVRTPEEAAPSAETKTEEKDPFDEIDFGSYFQDYLDPGYRTPNSTEISERPSFENFLSKPTTLTDHLLWQLGSLHLTRGVREAAELIVGNLDESGYLTASDEELLAALASGGPALQQNGHAPLDVLPMSHEQSAMGGPIGAFAHDPMHAVLDVQAGSAAEDAPFLQGASHPNGASSASALHALLVAHPAATQPFSKEVVLGSNNGPATKIDGRVAEKIVGRQYSAALQRELAEGLEIVRRLDPIGIAARDLRECLLVQLDARIAEAIGVASTKLQLSASADLLQLADSRLETPSAGFAAGQAKIKSDNVVALARRIIEGFLPHLLKRDIRELARLTGCQQPHVQEAIEVIRGLDPKPGQRYNRAEVRLVEPDVAFVKRDGEYVILINDEEMPTLRLNHGYRRMLTQVGTERDVKEYVKERYRSAIQLMRNIEQRKNTILRTCEVIVRRQREFLEEGVDALKPMMIKDVAEEIGVHASTVSRAVANKYVHTPQGVFELRFFFTEGVNGPEGAETPLLLLKRKVKKLIEEEDAHKPLTDDALAALLQAQGIAVNRRTVAKYREDMGIPSTHQRRVRI